MRSGRTPGRTKVVVNNSGSGRRGQVPHRGPHLIAALGGTSSGSGSKSMNLLAVRPKAGSQLEKAQSLSVRVLTDVWCAAGHLGQWPWASEDPQDGSAGASPPARVRQGQSASCSGFTTFFGKAPGPLFATPEAVAPNAGPRFFARDATFRPNAWHPPGVGGAA